MQVTILGRRWGFRFTRLPKGTDGECDDPSTPGKEIRIHKGLGEEDTLETTIHEALHVADWHRSEPCVEEVGRDIARILWKLGNSIKELDESGSK
jgi:hypothetical protein